MIYFLKAHNVIDSELLIYILIVLLVVILIVSIYTNYNEIKDFLNNNAFLSNLKKKKVIANNTQDDNHLINREDVLNNLSSNEIEDLQSLTRELEALPKERKIDMTPYEEEQEQTAIISYDELIKQNKNIDKDLELKNDMEKINNNSFRENVISSDMYVHEEAFLKKLKELNNLLN